MQSCSNLVFSRYQDLLHINRSDVPVQLVQGQRVVLDVIADPGGELSLQITEGSKVDLVVGEFLRDILPHSLKIRHGVTHHYQSPLFLGLLFGVVPFL